MVKSGSQGKFPTSDNVKLDHIDDLLSAFFGCHIDFSKERIATAIPLSARCWYFDNEGRIGGFHCEEQQRQEVADISQGARNMIQMDVRYACECSESMELQNFPFDFQFFHCAMTITANARGGRTLKELLPGLTSNGSGSTSPRGTGDDGRAGVLLMKVVDSLI